MQAVILAGGLGTRLAPLTQEVPKPMVIIGRKPFLHYQLALLERQGFTRILLLVGYLGRQIMEYFKEGRSLGLHIKYSVEDEPLGTAGALKRAEPYLEEEFLLVYGDSYLAIDYPDVVEAFQAWGKMGLMVVCEDRNGSTMVPKNVALDRRMLVTRYEKGSLDEALRYIDAGALAFRRQVTGLIAPGRAVSLEEEIFPLLIEQEQFVGYVTAQRFYDMGTPARLETLRRFLT